MKRTIVTTIALLGALALPGSAIAAAPAPVAAVDCGALQATYDGLIVRIDTLQERLATAPPAQDSVMFVCRVKDVETGYALCLAHGASPVADPADRPDWGPNLRTAHVRDPEGNLIELQSYQARL
jgi:hypothetical protein